eukprot:s6939_g2.t1
MQAFHGDNPKALTKSKELEVHQLLSKSGIQFDYQHHLPFRGCGLESETTRALADFVLYAPWGAIILEVDENQHGHQDPSCDVRRDFDMVASIALGSQHKLAIEEPEKSFQRLFLFYDRAAEDSELPAVAEDWDVGISAGQLATVLTAYTPQTEHTAHTADIGTNAAAIAALQGQLAALPAVPDLAPYALASDLAALESSILANASGLAAVNTSLTMGLAAKANQSALDALQIEVNGKSTPASVDLKLANYPTSAAMNSSIASANNATLATVAATYVALDVAARQTAGDVAQAIATALLSMASTSDLTAAVALRTTPADVSQLIATALLPYVQQTAVDAALALRDARLDGHDADISALQVAGPFASPADLAALETSLQSAIDAILAQ